MPAEEPPKKKGRGKSSNKVGEDAESQQSPEDEEPNDTEIIGFLLVPLTISNDSDRDKYSLSRLSKPYLQVI